MTDHLVAPMTYLLIISFKPNFKEELNETPFDLDHVWSALVFIHLNVLFIHIENTPNKRLICCVFIDPMPLIVLHNPSLSFRVDLKIRPWQDALVKSFEWRFRVIFAFEGLWISSPDESILIDELLAFVDKEVGAFVFHITSLQDCPHFGVVGVLD